MQLWGLVAPAPRPKIFHELIHEFFQKPVKLKKENYMINYMIYCMIYYMI
jgi:hypothetical protein